MLEDLGFVGFAIGFYEEKSQVTGTSNSMSCFTPQVVEYLHVLIKAGKLLNYYTPHTQKYSSNKYIHNAQHSNEYSQYVRI